MRTMLRIPVQMEARMSPMTMKRMLASGIWPSFNNILSETVSISQQ